MKIVVTGRNIDITPSLKSYAEEKISKFERYLSNITEVIVTLSVQKYRHKADVLIKANGNLIQAEGVTDELYSAIDDVAQKLERQLKKLKQKMRERRKGESRDMEAVPEEEPLASESPRIVNSDVFDRKPMSPDEAAMSLDLKGWQFLVFRNGHSNEVNVIYRMSDGHLGLVEPV